VTTPLIDPTTLASRLGSPDWVVVDCRFRLTEPEAGREAYGQSHIPGARYAHLDADLAAPPGPGDGRHPLPTPQEFAGALGRWGISDTTSVVVYDDVSGGIAARLWWMLHWVGHERVFVLDGGLQAWEAQGLPLERVEPHWEPTVFVPQNVRDDWLVCSGEVPAAIAGGTALVDARSRERFAGEAEPIDPVAGHVPGAVNYPFSDALTADGVMRPSEELRAELQPLVEQPGGIIGMCGSGVTACHLLLAVSTAGLGTGRLYVGSWSEWIRDPDRPIALGE